MSALHSLLSPITVVMASVSQPIHTTEKSHGGPAKRDGGAIERNGNGGIAPVALILNSLQGVSGTIYRPI